MGKHFHPTPQSSAIHRKTSLRLETGENPTATVDPAAQPSLQSQQFPSSLSSKNRSSDRTGFHVYCFVQKHLGDPELGQSQHPESARKEETVHQ
jgi:hypothetical protein